MEIRKSSLVGIKRQRRRTGLLNRLNIIIVKLNLTAILNVFLTDKNIPFVLLPRLLQPMTQEEFTVIINLILAVCFPFCPI